jgi:hypothetical protein
MDPPPFDSDAPGLTVLGLKNSVGSPFPSFVLAFWLASRPRNSHGLLKSRFVEKPFPPPPAAVLAVPLEDDDNCQPGKRKARRAACSAT